MSRHKIMSSNQVPWASLPWKLSLLCLAMWVTCLIGCRPSFEESESCVTNTDCFRDEICSLGQCLEGTPEPEAKPVKILGFSASDAEVASGEMVTLSWQMTDAVSATITSDSDAFEPYDVPADDLADGSTNVPITATTLFTLTARGEDDEDVATSSTKVDLEEVVDPPPPDPSIVSFDASSKLIKPDDTITVSWEMVDVDRAELIVGMETFELEQTELETGSRDFSLDANTNFELRAFNETRMTSDSFQVLVQGDAPSIESFVADMERVVLGGDVTLSWQVVGAERLELEDESGAMIDLSNKMLDNDQIAQTITANKSFTLRAINAYGSSSQTVSVIAYEALAISDFSASSEVVASGDQITLQWTIAGNPTSLTLTTSDDPSPIDLMGASLATGSLNVTIDAETTFILTAENAQGDTATDRLTVSLLPPEPVIFLFDASDTFVLSGSTVTITWQVAGATELFLSDDHGNMIDISNKMTDSDMIDVTVDMDTTYTLLAENIAGTDTASFLVAVGEPVTAQLSTSETMIQEGESVVLSWTTTHASSIEIVSSDGDTLDLTGKNIASDSIEVFPSAGSITYTLEAEGFAGPVSSSVTIDVDPLVNIVDFSASPETIDSGQSTTLSWHITDASTYTLEAIDSSGTTTLDTSMLGMMDSLTLTPAETTTYRLTANGDMADTDSAEITVTVSFPPSIDSFTATPDAITSGDTSTLAWTTSNATQIQLLDVSAGMMVPYTDFGDGSGEVIVQPSSTTDYILFAENAAGDVDSAVITITVTP